MSVDEDIIELTCPFFETTIILRAFLHDGEGKAGWEFLQDTGEKSPNLCVGIPKDLIE